MDQGRSARTCRTSPIRPARTTSHPTGWRGSREQETAMVIRLRLIQGRPQGQQLFFNRGEYLFGRGAECYVRPNSEWVSRQHCLLRVTAEVVSLRDLGSRNGTLVNGVRIVEERNLRHGDLVEVGPLVFEVQFDPPPEAPPVTTDDTIPWDVANQDTTDPGP